MNTKSEKKIIWIFILPSLFLYGLFVIYPILNSLTTSFYSWRGIGEKKWIGLDNYRRMLVDENFHNALRITFKYIIIQVPIMLVLALIISLVIIFLKNSKLKDFYKASIFLPYILPIVAVAMLWVAMLNPVTGILNQLLEVVGLSHLKREWLGQVDTAFGSVVWVNIWSSIGFYSLLIMSGILNIPEEVLEAAKIDGANDFQTSFHVVLPLLKPVLQVVITFITINSLKIFTQPQILTGGGPDRSTEPVSLYIYEQAFQNFNFGYASALGVVFLIIVLIITLVTLKMTEGEQHV